MKRSAIRIVVSVVVVLLLVTLGVQTALWRGLPKGLILRYLSTRAGVVITADSFSTGWTGTTTIKGLALTLPMDKKTFVRAEEVQLSHRILPLVLLTRSIALDSVNIQGPSVSLRQSATGRWNIQDCLSIVGKLRAGKTSEAPHGRLPQLHIRDGYVTVERLAGGNQELGPLHFSGKSLDELVWHFEMTLASNIALRGSLAPTRAGTHKVEFSLEQVADLLGRSAEGLGQTEANGHWEGRFEHGKLDGVLTLTHLEVGTTSVIGATELSFEPNQVSVIPRELTICSKRLPVEEVRLAGGSVQLRRHEAVANRLVLRTESSLARLDGRWALETGRGQITCSWANTVGNDVAQYQGSWTARVDSAPAAPKRAEIDTTVQGHASWGGWRATARIVGAGRAWTNSQWSVSAPQMSFKYKGKTFDASGGTARFVVDWPSLRLVDANLPCCDHLEARAQANVDEGKWAVQLKTVGLKPGPWLKGPARLNVVANGDPAGIAVSHLEFSNEDVEISAAGRIAAPSTQLENVHAQASWAVAPLPSPAKRPRNFSGNWRLESEVAGTIRPLRLSLNSSLVGTEAQLGPDMVRDIRIALRADANNTAVSFEATPFELLGGRWNLGGHHEIQAKSTSINLQVEDLALATAVKLVGFPRPCEGQVTAQLLLAMSGLELDRLEGSGGWKASSLRLPPFEAERAEGRLVAADGFVHLDPIQLWLGDGTAKARIHFALATPSVLDIQLDTRQWPTEVRGGDLMFLADSQAAIKLNVLDKNTTGEGQLSGKLLFKDKEIGTTSLQMRASKRTIEIRELGANILGGECTGSGMLRLDNWPLSRADATLQNMELARLADVWPGFADLVGNLSASVSAGAAEDLRAPEPLSLQVKGRATGGGFRNAKLDTLDIVAHAGKDRVVVDGFTIEMMEGKLSGRTTFSRRSDGVHTYLDVGLDRLSLNQLVHVFNPKAKPVAGRITGKGMLTMSPGFRPITGEVSLELIESDLINNTVIAALHGALSRKPGEPQASGRGRLELQAEGKKLWIRAFTYSNRGVEVWGSGAIMDLSLGEASPIEGYAVASTRPLRDVRLPGVRQLDRLMASLQRGAVSVKIRGTLAQPEVTVVPFPEVGTTFRRLLWGSLR
ncbi:MAG: hypothetical protein JSU70_12695 [Phycisphaerales bacterium]|nr:MAG: hypothetical protein JSU70_12695 [Phycisphaerales bacterium]